MVCYPTHCLYGLGADARSPRAVERIFELKRRAPDQPILVLIDTPDRLEELTLRVPPLAEALMTRFWPGKLTLVFEAHPSVSPVLTAGTGKIGIRLPGHPVARALVNSLKGPLTGTSANISGEPGCHQVKDIPDSILSAVSVVLDCGILSTGAGSTVVDITEGRPKVLREGVIEASEIVITNI